MTDKTRMSLIKTNIKSEYRNEFLNLLSNLNTVHIKSKSKKVLDMELEEDRTFSEKLKNLRQNLNTLFRKLKIGVFDFQELKFDKNQRAEFMVRDLEELLYHVSEEVDFLLNRINELEKNTARATIELEHLNTIKDCYYFLEKFNLTRDSSLNYNYLIFKVYTTFSKNLNNLTSLFEFSHFPNIYQYQEISKDRIVFYVIYPKDRENDFLESLHIIHSEEIPILKKYLTSDGINFNRIFMEINLITNNLSKYSKEWKRIRESNMLKFAAINEVVQNIEEYHWATKQFIKLSSGRLMFNFFVPANKNQEVIQYLKENLGKNIALELIEIPRNKAVRDVSEIKEQPKGIEKKPDLKSKKYDENGNEISEEKEKEVDLRDETPRVMNNFFLFRPFETLVRLYGTPSYSEIDPTPFLFFTFPILFGLMFGDMGHGIVLVISGLIGAIVFRKKKGTDFVNFCWIIFWCGWGAILAGFLYGEFFGMQEIPILGIKLEPIPIYLLLIGFVTLHSPLENIMTVFVFAILVGVAHICLGWFIQFLNYCKQKRIFLGLTDSLIKISLLLGGTILVFTWKFDINSWMEYPYPIMLVIIPGILLIVLKPLGKVFRLSYLKEDSVGNLLGEGSLETFETALSILSNVASYIRLLALALAHIALMVSIQAMIGLIQGEGILFTILIIIGLIFGNMMVILLEGILVFINAIRLHFYEFFFKFYQGTGIEFFPFYLDDDYSKITFEVGKAKDIISVEIEKEFETKETKKEIDKAKSFITKKFF